MSLEINDIDELIGKVLTGEASPEETAAVLKWTNTSADNQRYFDNLKLIFDKSTIDIPAITFDIDAAWNKMKVQLYGSDTNVKPVFFVEHSRQRIFIRLAAGIALLIGIGLFGYTFMKPQSKPVIFSSIDRVKLDTLPDGTTAFLNKRTSIEYLYNSKEKTRTAKLKGEGFFEIKHQEKPFIVKTEELLISDIGTSFNVKAYDESDTVVVTVKTGEVHIYTLTNAGLNLKEGETGIYSKRLKEFSRLAKADTNILAYKTGIFSFNSTNLRSVIATINEVYDVKISLESPSLENCPLTVNFHQDSLETIIDVIAETLDLTIVRNGDEIVLKGIGCNQ